MIINGVVDHKVKSCTSVTHGTHRLLCDRRWKSEVNNIDEVMYYVRGCVIERERERNDECECVYGDV